MKPPNPGSDEAIKGGCTCAVMDNHHGEGFPYPAGDGKGTVQAFYVNRDCPMHGDGQIHQEET